MSGGPRLSVIGSGSWGTAFASVTAGNGVDTTMWARRADLADAITGGHRNPEYLRGVDLPAPLRATHDLEEAVRGASIVVMAVPSHAFREILRLVAPFLGPDVPVVSLAKGIEQGSMRRMSEVLAEEAMLPPSRIAVLSGPNLAQEVALGQPSATVVACASEDRARELQRVFMAPTFASTRTLTWSASSLEGR